MIQPEELEPIARSLKHAQDNGMQLKPFSLRLNGFGIEDAYQVAGLIHQMRLEEGAKPAGRKIGFTNPEMWAIYGVKQPIWGYVYESTLEYHSGSQVSCSLANFTEPKIEPEIVAHFHETPPPKAKPADILRCIDWVAHGIEIVQSHFPGWEFQAADTVADGGLHARLIVGQPLRVDQLGDELITTLEACRVSLLCDGQVREEGRGSNALGSPLKAIGHLIEVLAGQPRP